MAERPDPGATDPRPTKEDVHRFVAKLEAFAATLSDVERELLRLALGHRREQGRGKREEE